jgi:peptidoglycan/LPS O-acetylase OafA/YrhL
MPKPNETLPLVDVPSPATAPDKLHSQPLPEILPAASAAHANNNFNLLRLLLALSVLLTHSIDLVDGDDRREPIVRLFHTVTLGAIAVDGFFLLSGFLIVQSWLRSPNVYGFFKKRVLRIYPAFIVASLVCGAIVGPLGSGNAHTYFHDIHWRGLISGAFLLSVPIVPPVFPGTNYAAVNGAMWTIGYEFRCYALVALLGIFGVVRRRYLWLALSIVALTLCLFPDTVAQFPTRHISFITLRPESMVRFIAFFGVGGCAFVFRTHIHFKLWLLAIAAILLTAALFTMPTAQLGLATCGAYLLFWIAYADVSVLRVLRTLPDMSYGTYLYGWPIQKLLLWYFPKLNPWALFGLTCVLALGCGFVSWHLVEKPFMRLKRATPQRGAVVASSAG